MEVEVTGTPEPTITWFKDDVPVEQSLRSEHRIISQGNCHKLIIDKGKHLIYTLNSFWRGRQVRPAGSRLITIKNIMGAKATSHYCFMNTCTNLGPLHRCFLNLKLLN